MRVYLDLVRLPGVVRITASQLLARFPLGMLSLAVLLHVRELTGSYAVSGLAVACLSVGQAVAMPVTSRLAGRLGIRRTIAALTAANAVALLVLTVTRPGTPGLLALGLAIGLSVPPLMPVVRALYPRLAPQESVGALFALDTSAQELIWILGPVVATTLAATVSTAFPLLVAAAVSLVGTAWFLLSRHVGEVRLERNRSPFGRVLLRPAMRLALAASFGLVASFGALELALVSRFDESGPLAGIAIAVASLGSLVGGIAIGHRRLRRGLLALILLGMAAATAAAALTTALPPFLALMFVAGLGFAPSLAGLYALVSSALASSSQGEGESAEAFGWLNTAGTVGGAVGTAVGGFAGQLVGTLSPVAGAGPFAASTLFVLGAAAVPLLPGFRRAAEA
ncbi:MFS transporter [Leifsonia sp. F6_8S_P_1B]|uniref:MFS transporter n=1 Tax=Leifsonia williamsii TaxID=3035919 RepID=A0ABT8K9C6_9MICO|nr:MFS transporter [Leifsonia williamsii]MDN4614063.1 MFS transporter [Leifsonia williamsii]